LIPRIHQDFYRNLRADPETGERDEAVATQKNPQKKRKKEKPQKRERRQQKES
jgi:hypothetical protein